MNKTAQKTESPIAQPEFNVAQATATIYELLRPFPTDERQCIVSAAMVLLREKTQVPSSNGGGSPPVEPKNGGSEEHSRITTGSPAKFFEEKDPKNKGEELAVAARYRELFEKAEEHTKEDLKRVVVAARRHFDASNFNRDITNARRQAGLFNPGVSGKGSYVLSYHGQKFVDALPDRERVKNIRKPRRAGGKRSQAKAPAGKK